jgi:hypothetical protein
MSPADFERTRYIATQLDYVLAIFSRTGRVSHRYIECAYALAAGLKCEEVHARAQRLISIAQDLDAR